MISIVTPSFRQVGYLKRCAASVADQGGDVAWEHLVQDGGGGDDFAEWAEEQSSAVLVSEKDEGMYDAINRGFRRASGDVLAWLNCDEQYLPGALTAVEEWFQEHPRHDILFGDVVLVDPDGWPLSYRQAIMPHPEHIRRCFLPTYSAATFVRRRVVDEGRLLDTCYRAIADAVWIHELLTNGYQAGVLNAPLAVFTQTGENLGQSEAGAQEATAWRGKGGVRTKLSSALHRLRKYRAGCYRKREVTVELHLMAGEGRVQRSGRIGERWRTISPA